ncbi:MAG: GAF domain-containing protein [Acidobacteria bacterium]|nr:GAF domain-containing protein [Acidobacteriota bacterium]
MTQVLIWGRSREMLAGDPFPGSPEEVDTLDTLCESLDGKGATLVLAEADRIEAERDEVQAWLDNGAASQVVLVAVADRENGDAVLEALPFVDDVIAPPVSPNRLMRKLGQAHQALTNRREKRQLEIAVERKSKELDTLNKIGVDLSAERDINKLLERILTKSREITGADAGSLYLVEREKVNGDVRAERLRFKLAQNDSVPVPFEESTFPLDDSSIAGHAARQNQPIRVDDVYDMPSDSPFRASQAFDEKSGYRTKSMLVVPMRDHQNEVIGIVQLINKKRDPAALLRPVSMVDEEVIPFINVDEQLAGSLASQAAVAFLNAKLLQDIQNLFESFVKAAAYAIEQRDVSTAGHSERVAILTVGLAQRVDAIRTGPFADKRLSPDQMRELEYAALLHDFGKVAVQERVLLKEKKLLRSQLNIIQHRFAYIAKSLEAEYLRRRLDALTSGQSSSAELAALEAAYQTRRAELDRILEIVLKSNEPTVVSDEANLRALRDLPSRPTPDWEAEEEISLDDWVRGPFLSSIEVEALSIRRGSLSDEERGEIENHVEETYHFLSRIPWTGDFRRIPEIAYAHHEKLNGTGYPRGLTAPDIRVESRMMTISDIYDALVAQDRVYKPAVSPERALDILTEDMTAGKLDETLLSIFIEARIWDDPEFKKLIRWKRRR